MKEKEKILRELKEKIEDVEKADGFFVTITCLNGNKLDHYQYRSTFKTEDLIPSLNHIKEMIISSLGLEIGMKGKRTYG